MGRYLYKLGVAASVMLNAVLGGDAPETLCYRAGKARRDGRRWGCIFCRLIDKLDPGHCDKTMNWWES